MPDITMYTNKKCKKRITCYRYMARPWEYQSYFAPNPSNREECEYYMKIQSSQKEKKSK